MTHRDGQGPLISMVVVVSANGVIGRDSDLPWRLSTDLKRFKELTMGKPIVMGRKTWQSFPRRPLPGRTNIVITRDRGFADEGALVVHSLDQGLSEAGAAAGGDEICVIGGGEIFRQAFDRTDRLYVTHIDEHVAGDTYFPDISPDMWAVTHEEQVPAGPKDDFATRFVIYERRGE